jgi:hypothetical protein
LNSFSDTWMKQEKTTISLRHSNFLEIFNCICKNSLNLNWGGLLEQLKHLQATKRFKWKTNSTMKSPRSFISESGGKNGFLRVDKSHKL